MSKVRFAAHTRRTLLGEKVILEGFSTDDEQFWFKPRKYSVEGAEEVRTLKAEHITEMPPEIEDEIVRITEEAADRNEPTPKMTEIWERLSYKQRKQFERFYQQVGLSADVAECILKHGIGEHNMIGEGAPTEDVPKDLIGQILENADETAHMVTVIEEWNSPLPRTTSKTSGTSQSGSTEGSTESETPESSRTDETPTG